MADNVSKDTSLQSTKQMLDELDALMERMLSVPINELDETSSYSKEWSPPAGSSLSASLTLLQAQPSVAPPVEENLQSPAPAGAKRTSEMEADVDESDLREPVEPQEQQDQAPHPAYNAPHLPVIPSKPTLADVNFTAPPLSREWQPLNNDVLPPSILGQVQPLLAQMPEIHAGPSLLSRSLEPIVWINQAFDHTTVPLGATGWWLRSQGGRMILGFCGVALLCVAMTWILKDWMGWNW